MSKILLIGESWFTYSVHQKGFDAFYTSEYVEGANHFIKVLRGQGHSVDYLPSHLIDSQMPENVRDLAVYDVIVISDVGANSFQLPAAAFSKSISSPDKSETVRQYVEAGGSVLMIGGYLTFSGIDAKARWGRSPLAAALPVKILDIDDRVELPAGSAARITAEHSVVDGLNPVWPDLLGFNEVTAKEDSIVLAEIEGHPLLVLGTYGEGRSAAFTSDIAPHWAPPGFMEWEGYSKLWSQLVNWLARS
jgi:uncharacterized membrane protein